MSVGNTDSASFVGANASSRLISGRPFSVPSVTRAKARDLHREIFSLQPRDDEDGLVADYRDNLSKRKTELERAKVKAEQKDYPGATEIAKALQAIDRQLAIRDPFEFLNAMLSNRDDWLDLAEDTHDVLSFYKTQAPVWARMLDGLTSFADNREALAKETASAQALADLEAIRANPMPYAQVNRIEALLSAVEKVNESLASARREKALLSIDGKIQEATQALDQAQADPSLRNAVLQPLQSLKTQLAGLVSIPRILFLQGRAGELLDEVMDKIAAAQTKASIKPAPSPTPGGTPTPPPPAPPAAKPIRVVRVDALIQTRVREDGETLNPESITVLDPACGSGHILVVAYDVLKVIYLERGYQPRTIPRLILEKNLYGLDIDDRAAQLAAFALLMKARADDRRLFVDPPKLNVLSLKSSVGLNCEELCTHLDPFGVQRHTVFGLIDVFEHAKTFGSLTRHPSARSKALAARALHSCRRSKSQHCA